MLEKDRGHCIPQSTWGPARVQGTGMGCAAPRSVPRSATPASALVTPVGTYALLFPELYNGLVLLDNERDRTYLVVHSQHDNGSWCVTAMLCRRVRVNYNDAPKALLLALLRCRGAELDVREVLIPFLENARRTLGAQLQSGSMTLVLPHTSADSDFRPVTNILAAVLAWAASQPDMAVQPLVMCTQREPQFAERWLHRAEPWLRDYGVLMADVCGNNDEQACVRELVTQGGMNNCVVLLACLYQAMCPVGGLPKLTAREELGIEALLAV